MALTRITQGVIKPNENYDTHDINSTGIITATGLNISGNASIGGVLTYEDVTSIDSVGLITARDGVFIPDSKKLQLGNAAGSADLQLYHDSSNSYIKDQGTGQLIIDGNAVILQYSSGTKLETTNTGVNIVGSLTVNGSAVGGVDSDGSQNTIGGTNAGDSIVSGGTENTVFGYNAGTAISTGDSNTFFGSRAGRSVSTGLSNTGVGYNVMGNASGNNNAALGEDAGNGMGDGRFHVAIGKACFSNTNQLGSQENNIVIGYLADVSSSSVSNEMTLGNTNINHLRVPGIGVTFATSGNHISGITTFSSNIHLGDTSSGSLYIGAGNDFRLYHNGQNSVLAHLAGTPNNGGGLFLDSATYITMRQNGNVKAIECVQYDAVKLYHNGSQKLETTSYGVYVGGIVSDSIGNVRDIPQNNTSGSYTLTSSDAGKHVRATGQITIPSGVFAAGQAITIYNNSSSPITIVQGSSTTVYDSNDASTGNKTLKARGLCTILCESNNGFVASGNFS